MAFRSACERGVVNRIGVIFVLAGIGVVVLAFNMPGQPGLAAVRCSAATEFLGIALMALSDLVLGKPFRWVNVLYLMLALFVLASLGPIIAAAGPAIGGG